MHRIRSAGYLPRAALACGSRIKQAIPAAQNHNRYSYVLNNPLSFSDPSGFSFWTKWRSRVVAALAYVATYILTSGCDLCAQFVANAVRAGMDAHQAGTNVGKAILTSAAGTILGGRVLGGAITTALNGGNRRQIGAALASGVVGEVFGANGAGPIVSAAASGCVGALAGGGNCGRGAGDALISMGIDMAAQAGARYVLAAHRAETSQQRQSTAHRGHPDGVGLPDRANQVISSRYLASIRVSEVDGGFVLIIRGIVDYDSRWSSQEAQSMVERINTDLTGISSDHTRAEGPDIAIGVYLTLGEARASAGSGDRLFLQLCEPCVNLLGQSIGGRSSVGGSTFSFEVSRRDSVYDTVVHEFLHLIGLHHSANGNGQIMSYDHPRSISYSERLRLLNLYK